MSRRILGWMIVTLTTVSVALASPAFGDPTTPGDVPDPGAPPIATGPLMAGSTATRPTSATGAPTIGPHAAQIFSQEAEVEALGEQVTKLSLELTAARQTAQQTQQRWQQAKTLADQLKQPADDAAAQAYKQATQLGPWSNYANDVNKLSELVPGGMVNAATGGTRSVVIDAATAEANEQTARDAYDSALAKQQDLTNQLAAKTAEHDQKATALAALKAQNTQELAQAQAAQDAIDANLAPHYAAGSHAAGQAPNTIAQNAVKAAMTRLGRPYLWGAEGPDYFDCSGLVWWAYRQAGYDGLPRVAADQYHATRPISTDDLVVGDLLFFSTTSSTDWQQISHVGIYVGGDSMIEAPSTGDVVKIAPIWWSAFFGATRVVGTVPAPAPPAAAPGPNTPVQPAPSPPASTPAPSPAPSTVSPRPVPSLPKPPPPTTAPPTIAPPTSTPPTTSPPTGTPSTAPPTQPSSTGSRSASAAASSSSAG